MNHMKYNVIIPIAYKDLEFDPIVIRRGGLC